MTGAPRKPGPANARVDPMQREHRVGIVLDESFGPRLLPLAQRIHVWAVESAANTPIARDVQQLVSALPGDPLDRGVTTFEAGGSSSWETLAAVVDNVDEHHGEHAHTPAWTVLEIYGIDEADAHKAGLDAYGVTEVERTEFGLEARRIV